MPLLGRGVQLKWSHASLWPQFGQLGVVTVHWARAAVAKVSCLPIQLVENCVCLLRNLSYQVHREIPHAERYQETPLVPTNNAGPHAASCFGAKKGKGWLGGGIMDLFQLQRGSRVVWDLCAAPLASLV